MGVGEAGSVVVGFAGASLGEMGGNAVLMAAFWAWLMAQGLKVFTSYWAKREWNLKVLFDSGGMPSSHSALVVGCTTACALQHGFGSTFFPISLCYALIVMYDAAGVRRHAGLQAAVLNRIVMEAFEGKEFSEKKLKEVLGHTPLQVFMGAALGVVVALLYFRRFVPA
mmetsp:Transcript_26075/g.89187  ORF Transcript_26075/g.89187 Transcript_26075/m.89187 type:complete len:168 (-) Transcript_26075:212-715(-)